MTPLEFAAAGIPLLLIVSNTARQAKALEELARIAGREHGIREQERAQRDALAAELRRGPSRAPDKRP